MAENLRSDGKAVDVTLSSSFNNVAVKKGDLIVAEGWFGIAMHDGTKGDTIAIETTQREFVLPVGSETAAKGDVLYIEDLTEGKAVLTDDATHSGEGGTTVANIPVVKVTKAKDTNNNVWAKLLPQTV